MKRVMPIFLRITNGMIFVSVATDSEISVWINDEQVIDCEVEGRKVAMRYGEIEMSVPLGICTYATTGVIREVFLKEI